MTKATLLNLLSEPMSSATPLHLCAAAERRYPGAYTLLKGCRSLKESGADRMTVYGIEPVD